jgi:phosphatidylserine/phosphatidylglycerophosphate/cardiolipin synthase-like enzyme
MRPDELQTILTQTIDDYRLSRSERKALTSRLEDAELDESDQALCHNIAFRLARETIDPVNSSSVLEWLEDVSKVLRRSAAPPAAATNVEACFTPGDDCWQRIASLLKSARQAIDICVFTITDDRVASQILDAHRRGVAVRVISDNDKAHDLGSDTERMAAAGVPVKVDAKPNHMHHKFAIFDRTRLLTGSYNWTRSASERNEENFLITDDKRLVRSFETEFNRLWDTFGEF